MRKLRIVFFTIVIAGCATEKHVSDRSVEDSALQQGSPAEAIGAAKSELAVVRAVSARHMFDQKTVTSTIDKVFDASGSVVYETPLLTWSGPKSVIDLPSGEHVFLITCRAQGGAVYNHHKIRAVIENGEDYTFFCLAEKRSWPIGPLSVAGLHAYISKTEKLEEMKKFYQEVIDNKNKNSGIND